MLYILFTWLLIFFNSFSFGFLFFGKNNAKIPITLITILGLCVQMIMVAILHIFIPINYHLLLFFLIIAIIILLSNLTNIKLTLQTNFSLQSLEAIFLFTSFLYVIFLSTYPIYFFDEIYYYIDTIRWIQNYSLVKGLANINASLGFMSYWHLLTALYEFPITTDSTVSFNYDLNGFLYLLFALFVIETKYYFSRITNQILILSFLLLQITILHYFITSSSVDLSGGILIVVLLAVFFEYEQGNKNIYASLIIFLIITILTIKITNFYILFLIFFFLKHENIKNLVLSFVLFGLVILVYFIRNIYLSGYLFYPFTGIGNLGFDWQTGIKINTGYFFWYYRFATIDVWIAMLNSRFISYNGLIVLVNYFIAILFIFVVLSYIFFKKQLFLSILKNKIALRLFINKHQFSLITLFIFILIHFFLFTSFKTTYVIRFIFGVIFWINALMISFFFQNIRQNMLVYLLIFLNLFNIVHFSLSFIKKDIIAKSFLHPQPLEIEKIQTESFQRNTIIFSIPLEGSYFCGNKFPCVQTKDFEMRGDNLEDGFKRKNK